VTSFLEIAVNQGKAMVEDCKAGRTVLCICLMRLKMDVLLL
jgi:hypothetical protein